RNEKGGFMSVAVQSQASTWNIDPVHSVAEFKVRHMMISNVKGRFAVRQGVLILDDADVTKSRVEVSLDAASVNTHEPQRDAHLKSPEFFEVEKFPTLSFKSTRVARTGEGELDVTGDLTIRGVTRSVVFKVEGPSAPTKDPWGNTRLGLAATAKINRKDFGLAWNATLETGGFVVGDEVAISLEAEFIKA
ncbi:MAG: YceI family protein, partial [Candidatus Acidiferrales bacterium]